MRDREKDKNIYSEKKDTKQKIEENDRGQKTKR